MTHHILVKQINIFSVRIVSLISRWVFNIMPFQWYVLPCYLYVGRTILQYNIETLNFVEIISIIMEVWFNQHIIVDKSNLFLVRSFSRMLWFYTIYYLSIGMFIFLFVCGTDYTSWQIETPHFVDVLSNTMEWWLNHHTIVDKYNVLSVSIFPCCYGRYTLVSSCHWNFYLFLCMWDEVYFTRT